MIITLEKGELSVEEQSIVSDGFSRTAEASDAPNYNKLPLKWLATNNNTLSGVLTTALLWDWLYIDELWVDEKVRQFGLGRNLMDTAESYATSEKLSGICLWTQSWQAVGFYAKLGYEEFARFPNFPQGHERVGFRKMFN